MKNFLLTTLSLPLFFQPASFAFTKGYRRYDEGSSSPSVETNYGTWVGYTEDGVDCFLGIPFAEPPTGSNRFMAPKSPSAHYGTYNATSFAPACPEVLPTLTEATVESWGAYAEDVVGLLEELSGNATAAQSEDCLYLNVYRPSNTTSSSKLPVMFWIFGGAFAYGASSAYPGEGIILGSIELGQPVILVTVGYRTNAFGFLAGAEAVANGGAINAGLLDQRLGMSWVQSYIKSFGGDPTKVTIFGESAGAISVATHLIANNGENEGLFRAAIMESGSPLPVLNAIGGQDSYDKLVTAANCSTSTNTFQCLQSLSYDDLYPAVNSLPSAFSYTGPHLNFLPRVDGTFITDFPWKLVEEGKFAKVPIIAGDQYDEGTLFALGSYNITTDAEVADYIALLWPHLTEEVVEGILKYYPSNVTLGSPFNTGDDNVVTPENKRISAILGDVLFESNRRFFLSYLSEKVPAWSYVCRALMNTPLLGSFHGSDVFFVFGQDTATPGPEFMARWINFAYTMNPNPADGGYIEWPLWNASKQVLELTDNVTSVISDDFREAENAYIIENIELFAY